MKNPDIMPAVGPGTDPVMPLLPSERQPHHVSEMDRVLALYYRTWMSGPQLIEGTVSDVVDMKRADTDGSPGFVNIHTAKTRDNPTGSFIGIDLDSAALIPREALPHFGREEFLQAWLADGSFAWEGEKEMLETLLRERVAKGDIGSDAPAAEPARAHTPMHGGRARRHTSIVPGSTGGKVAHVRSYDLS